MASSSMMLTVAELPFVFSDIDPMAQAESSPVCQIDYPSDFRIAYDYMRAIWKLDERSERALKLTATCLSLNPANYTVWHFRRLCLMEKCKQEQQKQQQQQQQGEANHHDTHADVTEEIVYADLELASILGGANPKNYQIAFHRRTLLGTILGLTPARAQRELSYLETVLKQHDAKNYHMWSSRQWILITIHNMAHRQSYHEDTTQDSQEIERLDAVLPVTVQDAEELWDAELQFTHDLIVMDCYNNSAWNQRWFVIHRGNTNPTTNTTTTKDDNKNNDDHTTADDSYSPFTLSMAKQEADYAISVIQMDPYNESPWRYLIGIIREHVSLVHEYESMLAVTAASNPVDTGATTSTQLQNVFLETNRSVEACVNYQSAHVDLLELKNTLPDIQHAMTICQSLAQNYDTIRQKYWNLRSYELEQKMRKHQTE